MLFEICESSIVNRSRVYVVFVFVCFCSQLWPNMAEAEGDAPEGDVVDPWYCNARPVWSSIVHLILVSEDLLRRCVATGILNEQQVTNIKAIFSCSNTYNGHQWPWKYYTCTEKTTPRDGQQDRLIFPGMVHAYKRLCEWAGDCEFEWSASMLGRNCPNCRIYPRVSELLLHELRRGGKDSYYQFWQCLAASFKENHLIDALCSFMSDPTLVLVDAKPVKGKKELGRVEKI